MLKIKIITIGSLKNSLLYDYSQELENRVSKYADLDVISLKGSNEPAARSKGSDFDLLSKFIDNNSYSALLDTKGKELTSIEFSNKVILDNLNIGRQLVFFIAGPYGLQHDDKMKFINIFSLSRLTFTHQMARIILLEQIYRSFTIINGISYHY